MTSPERVWAQWLPQQRWYAGRDRTLVSVFAHRVLPLGGEAAAVLLDAVFADGSRQRYQVLTPCDVEAASAVLSLIDADETIGSLRFTREPGVVLPAGSDARLVAGEQSNTSVVLGEQAILKIFRRPAPGVHPDIELTRVLTRSASPHVARLLGTYELADGVEPVPLGMVSAYVADTVDGWRMAIGGDGEFSSAVVGLGAAVASVHAALARELGTSAATVPVDSMIRRLEAALASVPQLSRYAPAIRERYAPLAGVPVSVQRIHGDLHLGQVLRTPQAWLVIDFEGEPGTPLTQRRQPDSVLRDVAGMLRSFDYAARVHPQGWAEDNRTAFCEGYADEAGFDPREMGELLAAYELDKAVYEAAYEARHRPDWLSIPVDAIARLVN